jgi:predicted dehydrogenase
MEHGKESTTRRNFLQATAVGAGAVYIPSAVKGANEKLNVGIIGVGGRGTGLLRQLVRIRDEMNTIEIVGVCDIYARRKARAIELCEAKGYDNYKDLLAIPGLDAVVIATPDHWHAKMTIDACKAGIDVYCEKPMTLTFDEAKKVWETVIDTRRVMQVGSQHASTDLYWQVRKAVKAGVIGPLVSCIASYARNSIEGEWNYKIEPEAGPNQEGENRLDWRQWLGDKKKIDYDPDRFFRFRKYWEYSGGVVTDLFYHRLTALSIGWGGAQFPWRVSSLGTLSIFLDREVPDTTSMLIDYPAGQHVNIYSSMANDTNLPMSWHGQEGSIIGNILTPQDLYKDGFRDRADAAGLPGEWLERVVEGRRGNQIVEELRMEEEPRQDHMENFLECVKTREKPSLDVLTGFQIMTAIAMAVESYKKGKTMYYDADKMKITDKPVNLPKA